MAKALERMNMKHEGWIGRQTIAGECRAVIAEYCCCDICGMDVQPCVACVDGLDWVDTYEICLDAANRVKGERAMTWNEYIAIRECVHDALTMIARVPTFTAPLNGCAVA